MTIIIEKHHERIGIRNNSTPLYLVTFSYSPQKHNIYLLGRNLAGYFKLFNVTGFLTKNLCKI